MWSVLTRESRKSDYQELLLQFRPRGSKDSFDAVEAAVEAANQSVEDAGWGDDAFTEGVCDLRRRTCGVKMHVVEVVNLEFLTSDPGWSGDLSANDPSKSGGIYCS